MKQYTRVYLDKATDTVVGVCTQDTPIAPDYEPVSDVRRSDGTTVELEAHDVELETESYIPSEALMGAFERAGKTLRLKASPEGVKQMKALR